MAVAITYTATSGMRASPKANNGDNVVIFGKTLSAPQLHATASSAVLLCKIPNNSVIYDAGYTCGDATSGVTATLLELRVGSTAIAATTSANQATAGMNKALKLPLKVSLSDDAAVQYAILSLMVTTAGTASTSLSIAGFIAYVHNDQNVL